MGKYYYYIDRSVIAEEEKYDGCYAIVTNLDDDAAEILKISEQRYKIEECFRILKTNFSARPVFHQTKEHITAHFLICYTALLIYRLLEIKVNEAAVKINASVDHFTTGDIIKTLRNMNVGTTDQLIYSAAYTGSQLLNALNWIYDLQLDRRQYLVTNLLKKIKKFL